MPRVLAGSSRRRKHKKILKAASGFYGVVSRRHKLAKQKTFRAGVFATRDRRVRKRDFRQLWIIRIAAACRLRGIMYSRLIHAMELTGVIINRKMLSEIAVFDPAAFDAIVQETLGKLQGTRGENRYCRSHTIPAVERNNSVGDGKHFKIKFPGVKEMNAAFHEEGFTTITGWSAKRHFLTLEIPSNGNTNIEMPKDSRAFLSDRYGRFGASVECDRLLTLEDVDLESEFYGLNNPEFPSLREVRDKIRAEAAWELIGRGKGVVIAVVDNGVVNNPDYFAPERRLHLEDNPELGLPKSDSWSWNVKGGGHGTMCAAIACGDPQDTNFTGLAPEATIVSCRPSYDESPELWEARTALFFEGLAEFRRKSGRPLVVTNSWGWRIRPSNIDPDLLDGLDSLIEAGACIVFSAGNNHPSGRIRDCSPNTIWEFKSRQEVMVVGTCDLDGDVWHYSSRGPGEWGPSKHETTKPDVVAPTPKNGRVLRGNAIYSSPNGWGTSGAAPQVAALCAILLGHKSRPDRQHVFSAIRETAASLNHWGKYCQGFGIVDFEAAARFIGA